LDIEVFRADENAEGLRVGVVVARFNAEHGDALRQACVDELARLGIAEDDLFVCSVPGALEIPVVLKQLAASGEFDSLIALGAVVRGETYHFEIVANESAAGVSRVALDFDIPIANGILTTDTDAQARERAPVKGAEVARAAVEMANLAAALASLAGDADE